MYDVHMMHASSAFTLPCVGQSYRYTRQLPMGPVNFQWGGLTDRNICNIYGDEHLASVGPTTAAGEAVTDAQKES